MFLCSYIDKNKTITQNQDKMKTKFNIALEGTCSGDVVGGLLSWTGESLQALLFCRKGGYMAKSNCGVVSWSIFDKVWHAGDEFRGKLRFLLINSDLDKDWGLNIIHDLINLSEKNADELWEKAKIEKKAGLKQPEATGEAISA